MKFVDLLPRQTIWHTTSDAFCRTVCVGLLIRRTTVLYQSSTIQHLNGSTRLFFGNLVGITLSYKLFRSERTEPVHANPENVQFGFRFVENHSNSCRKDKRQVKSQELPTVTRYMPLCKLFWVT